MRFLGRTLARRPRAGATLVFTIAATALTGCSAEFWKGRPDVDRVAVTVTPPVIAEGQSAVANGIAYKDGDEVITSSRVSISYSSSAPDIASVNSESGAIIGVSPGTAEITAEAQGKRGTATVEVVPADPATIAVTPSEVLTANIGGTVTITLEPRNSAGLVLPNRDAKFSITDERIARVTKTGPLTATVSGLTTGSATILATIGSVTRQISVVVRPQRPTTIEAQLQNGTTSLQVTENQQIMLTFRDAENRVIPTTGYDIRYTSSDVTVASVNTATGVVTGNKVGTAEITITVDNDPVSAKRLAVTVVQQKVEQLLFGTETFTFRTGGGPRNLAATPLDSNGRVITTRTPAYESSNSAVATVSAIGIVTPRAIGSTMVIARIDNLADTLTVHVTPLPITNVRVDPAQQTARTGETRQYTATLFDSLGNQVANRTVIWQTNNPSVATVDQTGLATAGQAGTVQIEALVDAVPGFPGRVGGVGILIVQSTPIARVEATPASVSVRVGQRTSVSIRVFDDAGRELFGRLGSIQPIPADPSVASSDQSGTITGLKAGTTTITYQAVNLSTGLAQGTPATITVNVTP